MIKLEPADIILTKTKKGCIGNLILRTMRAFQKDKVYYQHAALVVNDNEAIEALWTVELTKLEERFPKFERYKIIRCPLVGPDRKQAIVKQAKTMLGKKYSYKRIFFQLLDQIFRTNRFTNGLRTEDEQICSSLVAWCYEKQTGLKINKLKWQSVEPDDIDDASIKNPAVWETIYEYRRD